MSAFEERRDRLKPFGTGGGQVLARSLAVQVLVARLQEPTHLK